MLGAKLELFNNKFVSEFDIIVVRFDFLIIVRFAQFF